MIMADVQPFTISIPDSELSDLKTRLSLARFPDELDESGWDYGAPLSDIKRLTAYWKDEFDWRQTEAELNKLPQYRTKIEVDGFDPIQVHFIHQKSNVANAVPLLFVHGWPGSFIEATKIWDKFPNPPSGSDLPAFHFVGLSLPHYGFSEGVKKKGFALAQYAETGHKLMQKLGYKTYVCQGGDWGYFVTRSVS
jgi:pimeloyl-ACP methyl ester carboxylesterase